MQRSHNSMIDHNFTEFSSQELLQSHIAYEALKSLSSKPNRRVVIDSIGGRRRVLRAGVLLALGLSLARYLKKNCPEKRIGVLLPPGVGAFVANLGIFLANKTPVNLNFTAPNTIIAKGMQKMGLVRILSVPTMRSKYPHFPWTEDVLDISELIRSFYRGQLWKQLAAVYVFPYALLAASYKIPKQGGAKEASLLLTSGSQGDAKIVLLSHRNLIANTLQIAACRVLPDQEKLLGCLPIFHSFGFTVTLIYPLLKPITVVTHASPLDVKRIGELIEKEQVGVHLGTPSFFRPYLKALPSSSLSSLRAVVAGAEKTAPGFHEKWESQFNSRYLEGYGLTETSPVVSVNLPDDHGLIQSKKGSVGRLFIGMAARIVGIETGEVLPLGEVGLLELKGANIFEGYLEDPIQTEDAFHEGWFKTQDLASLDGEGFLYIEGRMARFSKIAGEMVSHGAIEAALASLYGLDNEELPWAIVGIPDAHKGEAVVLVSSRLITHAELIHSLAQAGFPNLWIPKHVIILPSLPLLASGKLDLKGLKEIALAHIQGPAC